MSTFKLVDSVMLDNNLTSVADEIRKKSGSKSDLNFPEDFITEIENIGGGTIPENFISIIRKATFCTSLLTFTGTTYNGISLSSGRGVCRTLPEGNEYISVEAYYNSTNDGTGYILSMGALHQRQTFSFTPSKFVGYDDDHAFSQSYQGKHHIVVTYDKSTIIKIYIDGELTDTISLGGALNIVQNYFNQGSWMETNYECFEGEIYYTRIYKNILLTEDEILILYKHREDFVN